MSSLVRPPVPAGSRVAHGNVDVRRMQHRRLAAGDGLPIDVVDGDIDAHLGRPGARSLCRWQAQDGVTGRIQRVYSFVRVVPTRSLSPAIRDGEACWKTGNRKSRRGVGRVY